MAQLPLFPLWCASCRLKDTCGSLSSVLLYVAYFLPTTINTAWVSVAAGVGVLIIPEQYRWDERTVEGLAVLMMVLVTAMGEPSSAMMPPSMTVLRRPSLTRSHPSLSMFD